MRSEAEVRELMDSHPEPEGTEEEAVNRALLWVLGLSDEDPYT